MIRLQTQRPTLAAGILVVFENASIVHLFINLGLCSLLCPWRKGAQAKNDVVEGSASCKSLTQDQRPEWNHNIAKDTAPFGGKKRAFTSEEKQQNAKSYCVAGYN